MEWSNIRMSKAEFERLQKEYAEAAIRTAEKARLSYDADEPKEEIPKAENIAAAISRLPTPAEENVNEAIKPDSAKITTVQVKITEAESEITASDTEDENKESEEAKTNIPVNEEKSDENTDKSDTDDKQQNSSAGSTDDEASNAEIYGDKSDNTADSEIAVHLIDILVKLCPEGRIFYIMNGSVVPVLPAVNCHPGTPCTEMGMIICSEKQIKYTIFF